MASIRLEHISKTYPNGQPAAHDINLEVCDGEFLVLVGPSGCGKTTALRIVAGLESPTQGRVFIGSDDVTDRPPQDRDVAMVFQNYALYPHMTVRENLAFGVRMRRVARDVAAARLQRAARTLGLEEVLDRRPAQLSGGQRQRVALARAIVREPRAFLLDEPLSNLDAKLRVQTRAELSRIHRQLAATMLYVTHDQQEALTLGDRIAVLHDGRLQQVAAPMDVYRRPTNVFVAEFIGSPTMNFFRGTLRSDAGRTRLEYAGGAIDARDFSIAQPKDSQLLLGVRPHDVELVNPADADLRGRVDGIEPLGNELLVHVAVANAADRPAVTIVTSPEAQIALNDAVGLRLRRDRLHLFDAAAGTRLN